MQVIKNPSKEQLDQLQSILSGEPYSGIVDIYGVEVSHYLAIEDAGSLVGVASICILGTECAELHKLYVIPSYRARGIGTKLFEETLRFLSERKLNELLIEMEDNSQPFW